MQLTISINNKKRLFLKVFFLSSIIAVSNILFSDNKSMVYILASLELITMILCFIKRSITDCLIVYVTFLSTALEFESLSASGVLYSVKTIRLAGINLGVWMLIPIWLLIILSPIRIGRAKQTAPCFWKLSTRLLLMNLVAMIVGLLLVIINDNGIRNMNGYIKAYVGSAYSSLLLPITFFGCFLVVITTEKKEFWKIGIFLQAVLCSAVVQIVVAYLMGLQGKYGNERTLLIATIYFFVPLLFLIPMIDTNHVFSTTSFIFALIGTVLVILHNATGKIYLTILLVVVIVFFKYKNSKNKYVRIVSYTIFSVTLVGIVLLTTLFYEASGIGGAKLRAAVEFISVWEPDWLQKMQYSPKARIAELLNVCIEFFHKPWLIITGKGYLGSIRDHVNMFGDMTRHTESYRIEEWTNGLFYNLHEVASNLLMFGVMGILYSIDLIKTTYKSFIGNPFLLIGAYWFLLLYGYSFTLSVFGIVCFYYGLARVDMVDELYGETNENTVFKK